MATILFKFVDISTIQLYKCYLKAWILLFHGRQWFKHDKKVYDQLFPQIQDGCQISLAVKWHILTEYRI